MLVVMVPLRSVALVLSCAMVAWSEEPPHSLLTSDEGAAVDAVLDQAIALGFPEAREAHWHESRNPFYGPVDFELTNGGWLQGSWNPQIHQLHDTPATDAVKVWHQLVRSSAESTVQVAWHLLRIEPMALARMQRASETSLNGLLSDSWPGWGGRSIPHLALPGALLRRCGATALGDRLLLQAQYQHTRAEYRLCFTTAECKRITNVYETPAQQWDERLSSTLWFPYERCDRWVEGERRASVAVPAVMTLVPLVSVLRRECHWWFRQRLAEDDGTKAVPLGGAALAILDAGDRVHAAGDISLMSARAAVPKAPPPDAPLVLRLAAWDLGPFSAFEHGQFMEWDLFTPLNPEEYRERYLPSTQPERQQGRRRYDQWLLFRSFMSDTDALVRLLDSTAPCRWLEDGTPRLLGDNALRALTVLWSVDPRLLVGRDRFAPWDDAERAATAGAVQKLWRSQGQQGIDAAIRTAIGDLPPWSLNRLHELATEPQRSLLDGAITASWREGPREPRDRQEEHDLNDLLAVLAVDPALAATIRRWPVHGFLARELMLVHELVDDGTPLDDHLRRVVDGKATDEDVKIDAKIPSACLAVALWRCNAKRARLLFDALATDPASPVAQAMLQVVRNGGWHPLSDPLGQELIERTTQEKARALFIWVALADQRLVSADLANAAPRGDDHAPLAADLRFCDLAMAGLNDRGLSAGAPDPTPFRLSLARIERDRLIAARRAALLPMATHTATLLGLEAGDFRRIGLQIPETGF